MTDPIILRETKENENKIHNLVHPVYTEQSALWSKFRLTFEGGKDFVTNYLQKFSNRETESDYVDRRAITPPASHAKAALMDINNAIFTRMIDIQREGGPDSYQKAVQGEGGGVDLEGASMNTFLGVKIMPELLAMGRVGVFIDKPRARNGSTLNETQSDRPYLYTYRTEDIRSWAFDRKNRLISVLLRDNVFTHNPETGLPQGRRERFRLLQLLPEGVQVTIFDGESRLVETVLLNLNVIPFTIIELSQSLLTDTADLQIALMNLGSSDINYALRSNFPFYVEQYEPRLDMAFNRPAIAQPRNNVETDENGQVYSQINHSTTPDTENSGTAAAAQKSTDNSADVGATQGRRYASGLEAPKFINPSPEPLKASMDKQDQMKADIRILINLSLVTLRPGRASAESKNVDKEGLESGLARIAAVLENSERQIAIVWSAYERAKDVAIVTYPEDYTIQSHADRLAEAKELQEIGAGVPSFTYQKAVMKRVAELTVKQSTTNDELNTIDDEIDEATVVDTNPEHLYQDVENGLATAVTVSQLRGYAEGEAEAAQKERAERMAVTAIAQSSANAAGAEEILKKARGTDGGDPTDDSGKTEKELAGDDNA